MMAGTMIEAMREAAKDMRLAACRAVDGERLWAEFTELGFLFFATGVSGGRRWQKSVEVRWEEALNNPALLRSSADMMIRAAGLEKK